MGKILTISIAAYNVEQYIGQALDSLIDERIIDDLEIFVVDDGGTDKTLEIAKRYAEKYPQSIFPIHKENGGYGSTINTSVRLATGKYFKQLDGDDWFDKDNLYRFVELLKTIDADLVATQTVNYNECTNEEILGDTFYKFKTGRYDFEKLGFNGFLRMHCSAFKTGILKENALSITEHCFYTDLEYVNYPVPYIKSIYICHYPIYMYRIGREGQSISVESLKKHYKEHQTVIFDLCKLYKSISVHSDARRDIILTRLVMEIRAHFKYLCYFPMSRENCNKINDFYQNLKQYYPDIIQIVLKEKLFVKLFAYTNGFAYPLMRFITILYLKGLLKPILKLKRLLKRAE